MESVRFHEIELRFRFSLEEPDLDQVYVSSGSFGFETVFREIRFRYRCMECAFSNALLSGQRRV